MEKIYLGIDWGEKRIGLALGDSETKIATPYDVAENLDEVLRIVNKEEVDFLVVGQPIKMSGSKNNLTDGFEKFMVDLKNKTRLPIFLIDERLTSKAADALIGTKKTKSARDAIAAMLILQAYFDKNLVTS